MRTDINRPSCWLNMSFIRVLRMEDVDIDIYESFCTEKYVSNKTTNKSVTKVFVSNVFNLLVGKVQDVVGFCNNSSAKLAKLKHKVWYRRGTPDQQYINNVQQKGYGSMSIPGEDGVHTRVLTVHKKIRNQKISGVTSAHTSDRLIVVPIEDFHPTLKALHQATGHGKERVMLHKVADQYEGLPKSAVVKYISMCMTCNRNKAQVTQAPPRVIISQGLFSRCQVDLVDMTRKPSGGYKYIIHLMDHFSKFHLLAPLVQKTQAEVNLALSHMFSVIGIPSILHTDNGAEFGALDRLLQQWPGSSDVVHGRPRHPQSQGLVERGNRVLEEKISAMEATYHGDGPAPWHLWLPLIQYQLNTIVSRVIQMTPYECVFGKKPPSPPPLGRPARVIAQEEVDVEESQEDSQECDPLLDHSYAGSTNGPEAEDENLSHEAQVETTSAPEAEDENVNVSREAQVETTSAPEAEDENVNVSREAQVENATHRIWKPEELATTERHRSRRVVANQAYLQEASRRMNAPTPNVVHFKVGDLVSIKVPRSDRHKTDCKRILGIVVNQHGEKDPSFRIRCKYGMLAGRYRGDSLLPFQGAIPELSVDGWKDDEVISLRTASMCFSKAVCPANVCKCRVGCQSRRCICFRNKIQCQAACHAGRCCQNGMEHDNARSDDLENMESEELDSRTEDHQCDIPVTFKVFVQQLIESGFQETECQSCLSAISHAGSWEALSSTARYIAESLPDLQTEEPIPIIHAEKLGIYGDGFIQFIPLDIRTSHTVFQTSVDDNNCLFNSISLVLWGHAKKTVYLRLAAAIYGIVNHEKMVDQVMEGIVDWNDAVAWVNRSTTANISDDATMMQQPRRLVKLAIEKELFATLKGTDSAQVQFMSLAGLLRKKITVRNYNEDIYPQEIFGIGEEIILLRVPVQLPSVDGNIRLSHLVPAIPFTPTEKDAMEMCICESFGVCSEDDSMGWVACIVCCRWSHCACIGRHGCKHYQEKEFTCGCNKIRLKQFPVFNNTSLLNVFLKKQRSQLKNAMVKTCSKTSKSWRMRDFDSRSSHMVRRLTLCSGLNIPNESVVTAIRKFIEELLQNPTNTKIIDLVLFPEVLIHLMAAAEGISYLEAEVIIKDSCHQKLCY